MDQQQPQSKEEQRYSRQFHALFNKSCSLQMKQIGTNLCQIFTPLLCLFFTWIIRVIAQGQGSALTTFNVPTPILFLPQYLNSNYSKNYTQTTDCVQWFGIIVSQQSKDYVGINDGKNHSTGLLGQILESTKKCQYNQEINKTANYSVPFFKQHNGSSQLYDTLKLLNQQQLNRSTIKPYSDKLPDGVYNITVANSTQLSIILSSNDVRLKTYHRLNGVSAALIGVASKQKVAMPAQGQLFTANLINTAFVRKQYNKQIVSGIIYMPLVSKGDDLIQMIINLIGGILFPLSLSLLLPVFMYTIVLQKQQRLLQMMKMNGMKIKNYWIVTILFNLLLSIITFVVFWLFGFLLVKLTFFTQTSLLLTVTDYYQLAVFLGWAFAQISLSIFFQTFLSHSRSANIIGYILSIWTALISTTLNAALYPLPNQLPIILRLYPPFAFNRLIYLMMQKCSMRQCLQSLNDIDGQMEWQLASLYLATPIFIGLGIYLYQIWPKEFGTSKSPLFIFDCCLKSKKQQNFRKSFMQEQESDKHQQQQQDEDARKQNIVQFDQQYQKYPLICKNLNKVYGSGKTQKSKTDLLAAVKAFCLSIKPGQIFGLLGPNGAGKTSLLSMITGIYPPNAGNAWIEGYDIKDQLQKVQLLIGVCPQFDLLWPQLTVQQHIYFYCRLKGIPSKQQKYIVDRTIEEVGLTKFKKNKSRTLSGGMKRRLSVAISLSGSPSIVFLDQPTTGLDPQNRRGIWQIISSKTTLQECKKDRAMLLTTHSMQQADLLCSRIGIMTDGILRCVGKQVMLKAKYGGGYFLSINYDIFKTQSRDKIMQLMKSELKQFSIKRQFNGNIIMLVKIKNKKLGKIFEIIEGRKRQIGIREWMISQPRLEDVFMNVVTKYGYLVQQ